MNIYIPEEIIEQVEEYIALQKNDGNLCRSVDNHKVRLKVMQMKKEHIADLVLSIIAKKVS